MILKHNSFTEIPVKSLPLRDVCKNWSERERMINDVDLDHKMAADDEVDMNELCEIV